MKTPILVSGALGRMGRLIIDIALADEKFSVTHGITRPKTSSLKPAHWEFPLHDSISDVGVDGERPVILDFSEARQLKQNVAAAQRYGCGILVGTTGHREEDLACAREAASTIPVLIAPNTSLMANLLIGMCKILASSVGDCDISIVETHHREKKDAPSGTAKALAAAISHAREDKGLDAHVDVHSIRAGTIVGDHGVSFVSNFEKLELHHRALDRRLFAQGALVAAQFLFGRPPGLYCMNDVLNLNITIKK